MKSLRKILFNFSASHVYTFLSGVMVSLAANTVTGALMSNGLLRFSVRIYEAAALLILAALSGFVIGIILQRAREDWILGGCPTNETRVREDFIEKGIRLKLYWIFFFGGLICLILCIHLLIPASLFSNNSAVEK